MLNRRQFLACTAIIPVAVVIPMVNMDNPYLPEYYRQRLKRARHALNYNATPITIHRIMYNVI